MSRKQKYKQMHTQTEVSCNYLEKYSSSDIVQADA